MAAKVLLRNTGNYASHGADFYARIGFKGGSNGHTGGFAAETIGKDGLTGPERAKLAGAKGGTISKRGPAVRLTAEKIKQVRKELNEAEQVRIESKIKLLNKELERLRHEITQ